MLRRHIHGSNAEADDPLIWYEGAGAASANARYLYADPRGSIALVASSTGGIIAQNSYDEYGIKGSANAGRFQYTGQAWLPELGMYYYKARIYSPTLGRFLQTDPIGYKDNINLYGYVANDPVNRFDFDGKEAGNITCMNNACGQRPLTDEEVGNLIQVGAVAFDILNTPISPGPDATIIVTASRGAVEAAKRPSLWTKFKRFIEIEKKPTCCFVAGTLVDTEKGLRPIEEIAVGDKVWARDESTGETALKAVTDLIHRHERVIWEVTLTGPDGEIATFETTDDHPWWVAGQGWKRTAELAAGMAVVTRDGRGMVLASVIETGRTDVTYNLTVADFETYFVGEQRVLVHNCPGTYRVPGERTSSGKDYVGQTGANSPNARSGNGRDGRVREAGDQTSSMPGSTRREREMQEQREINAAGGVDNLDNQRNSVSPKKWEELGIDPPK